MSKSPTTITPPDRLVRWKKLWATPKKLDDVATEAAFDEFREAFVPSHMHKRFLKLFGVEKAAFGNRFFDDEAVYRRWDSKLSTLSGTGTGFAEVTVIYASPDSIEAHALRGEMRRALRDIFIDDWHAACAVIRTPNGATLYAFVEPKMKGCVVLSTGGELDNEVESIAD